MDVPAACREKTICSHETKTCPLVLEQGVSKLFDVRNSIEDPRRQGRRRGAYKDVFTACLKGNLLRHKVSDLYNNKFRRILIQNECTSK